MNDPFENSEPVEAKPKGWSFWSKILLIAIIYTLLGLGFVIWCYFYRERLLAADDEGVSRMLNEITLLTSIIWGAMTFFISGITSIVICLIMKNKERALA